MIPWRGRRETNIARESTAGGGSPWEGGKGWGSSTWKVGGDQEGGRWVDLGRWEKLLTSSFNFLTSMN